MPSSLETNFKVVRLLQKKPSITALTPKPKGLAAPTDLTIRFLQIKMAEYERLKLDIERLKDQAKEYASATAAC